MKNLFNNISKEEKNRILEMHSDRYNLISEQPTAPPAVPSSAGGVPPNVAPPKQTRTGGVSGNKYKKPPYCKIGQSEGKIVIAQTGSSGPDTSLGETGFALSLNGKVVCLISTKYTQGGYVTTPSTQPSTTQTTQPAAV